MSRRSELTPRAATGGRVQMPPPGPRGPDATHLWGFADLHTHLMGHLAFGGGLLWGRPDGPITQALPWCTPMHGPGGVNPLVGLIEATGYGPGIGHLVGGSPQFDGWPRFTTTVHQQMYVDWLRRAFDGGLRLLVALAVNNKLFASAFAPRKSHSDRDAVKEQVEATRAFAARHAAWMGIAYTPADARRLIGEGKLAIVLGIEVDTLGDWPHERDCSQHDVQAYVERIYHELGVRHVFPIHLSNNAFGGTAIYNDLFNVNTFAVTGAWIQAAADRDVEFRLDETSSDFQKGVQFLERALTGKPNYGTVGAPPVGHVNQLGLTQRGRQLIDALVGVGMIIDVDHMSQKSVHETLEIVEQHGYPVTCGHTAFRAMAWKHGETSDSHKLPNEFMRTVEQLGRIRKLGGMIAVGMNQGDVRDFHGAVPNDCAGSSKSWAQAYQYAVDVMGGAPVALGSDFNGLAKAPAPRFGFNATWYLHNGLLHDDRRKHRRATQVGAQSRGVAYTDPIVDYRRYRFEGILEEDPHVYDDLDRDIWQALTAYHAGFDPWKGSIPDLGGRPENFAKGFAARSDRQLLKPGILTGNSPWEQRAAFLVAHGQQPKARSRRDPKEVRELYPRVKRLWDRWNAMQAGNPPTIAHSRAGRRDFDINLDGVAHVGMLPDFIQDLKNVGLSEAALSPLFRSAEGYIEMWERCERQKARPAPAAERPAPSLAPVG